MYYVYILRCSDDSLYTGITTDVKRRFLEHKNGKASKYTYSRKPKEIVYTEEYSDRGSALKREIEIKKLRRKDKLRIIKN